MQGEGGEERGADNKKVYAQGSLEPSQGQGLSEKPLGTAERGAGVRRWGHRLGREGGRRGQQLHTEESGLFSKSKGVA